MPMPTMNAWWQADGTLWQDDGRTTAVTADGQAVGAADDASGNARHALQSNSSLRPLYKTGIQNALPGLLFDGTDDALNLTGFVLSDLIAAGAQYGFAVFKATAIDTNSATPESNDALWADVGGYAGVYLKSTPVVGLYNYDGTEDFVTAAIDTTSAHLVEWRHESGNIYVRVDGGTEFSAASNNTQTLTSGVNIGAGYSGAKFQGYLFELGIAATVPSAGDQDYARNYLTTKWFGGGGGAGSFALVAGRTGFVLAGKG